VQITLPLDISLPEDYVADEALRLQLYRRLSGLITMEDIKAVESELTDRFGPLPKTAQNLLYQLRLKAVAVHAGVEAIVAEHRELVIRCEALEHMDRAALQRILGERITVRRRDIRLAFGEERTSAPEVWQAELARTLEAIRDLASS
jgi:transcription-repair coupling factor (superfamily II helicase)